MNAIDIVIRIRYKLLGGHYHLRVFVGKDYDHLAKSGDLALREEEMSSFMSKVRAEWIDESD